MAILVAVMKSEGGNLEPFKGQVERAFSRVAEKEKKKELQVELWHRKYEDYIREQIKNC